MSPTARLLRRLRLLRIECVDISNALLRAFGSVKRIREASEEEVAEVVGPKTAIRVATFLKDSE